ncbi:MAG: lipoate--protein ligase family protein [Robiginitomaculum sp.]|nr:lipoate--protein ligase family protein [Robiginitomaculum sp.]
MNKPEFRVIDTGLRSGRENIAFDAAMIEAHQTAAIGDSIRFIHFKPCALVGRHQDLSRELKLNYCTDNNIQTVRRITGGGAIYMDQGQIGWALVFSRKTLNISDLGELTKAICEAAAHGLSKLGIEVQFRPRNDIEVGGRKIGGSGGFFDGNTLFFQGTVLIDTDPSVMMSALNVAKTKLQKRQLDDASTRVTTLKQLLETTPTIEAIKQTLLTGFEEKLGISLRHENPYPEEEHLAKQYFDEEIGQDDYVHEIDRADAQAGVLHGSHTGAGGTVEAFVRLEGNNDERLREVLLTGDFFVTPPRIVLDLESHLRRVEVCEISQEVQEFFAKSEVDLLSISPDDFVSAIENALKHTP